MQRVPATDLAETSRAVTASRRITRGSKSPRRRVNGSKQRRHGTQQPKVECVPSEVPGADILGVTDAAASELELHPSLPPNREETPDTHASEAEQHGDGVGHASVTGGAAPRAERRTWPLSSRDQMLMNRAITASTELRPVPPPSEGVDESPSYAALSSPSGVLPAEDDRSSGSVGASSTGRSSNASMRDEAPPVIGARPSRAAGMLLIAPMTAPSSGSTGITPNMLQASLNQLPEGAAHRAPPPPPPVSKSLTMSMSSVGASDDMHDDEVAGLHGSAAGVASGRGDDDNGLVRYEDMVALNSFDMPLPTVALNDRTLPRPSTPVHATRMFDAAVPSHGAAGAALQRYASSSYVPTDAPPRIAGQRHPRTDDDGDPARGSKRARDSFTSLIVTHPVEAAHWRWTSMLSVIDGSPFLAKIILSGGIPRRILHRVILREVEDDFEVEYRDGDGTSVAGYACVAASKGCATFVFKPKAGVNAHLSSVATVTGGDGFPPLLFPPEVIIEHRLTRVPCPVAGSNMSTPDDTTSALYTLLRCGLQPLAYMHRSVGGGTDTAHAYLPNVLAVYVTMLDHVFGVARVSIVMPCPRYAPDKLEHISFPISIQLPSTDEPPWHMLGLNSSDWPQSRLSLMRGEIASANAHLSRLLASSSATATLRNHPYFPLPLARVQAKVVVLQLLMALRYLHALGFVHGNVKPDSILVDSWGMISGVLYPHIRLLNMRTCARLTTVVDLHTSVNELQAALCEVARSCVRATLAPQMKVRMDILFSDTRSGLEAAMISAPYAPPEQTAPRVQQFAASGFLTRSSSLAAAAAGTPTGLLASFPKDAGRELSTAAPLSAFASDNSTLYTSTPLSLPRSFTVGAAPLSRADSATSTESAPLQPRATVAQLPVAYSSTPAYDFTPAMDVFAVGATLFALLTRAQPWPADASRRAFPDRFRERAGVHRDAFTREEIPVADALEDAFPRGTKPEAAARDFLSILTTADPASRPCAHHAMQHPWLADARVIMEPVITSDDLLMCGVWGRNDGPPPPLCNRTCFDMAGRAAKLKEEWRQAQAAADASSAGRASSAAS